MKKTFLTASTHDRCSIIQYLTNVFIFYPVPHIIRTLFLVMLRFTKLNGSRFIPKKVIPFRWLIYGILSAVLFCFIIGGMDILTAEISSHFLFKNQNHSRHAKNTKSYQYVRNYIFTYSYRFHSRNK